MNNDQPFNILVVDDDSGTCNALVRVLRDEERHFTIAHSVDEAMAHLPLTAFDLIISDFKMPGQDGMTLLAHARTHYPDILRIMLSAYSDREILMDAVNRGSVFRFITKPWDADHLREMVNEALEQCRTHRNQRMVQSQLERASVETVMAIAETIELKDPYTKGHCSRVRDYSLMLADKIDLPQAMRPHLIYGSLLHDCGKIGIQEAILLSQVPFNSENRKIMEAHPVLGFQLTNKIDYLKTASLFIRQHHERWDGKGYPDGLKGEQIHLCSRIISIADAFDAMTTDRPYHKGMPVTKAVKILQTNRGTQFDPLLVDTFIEGLESDAGTCLASGNDLRCKEDHGVQVLLVDDEINVLRALTRCLMGEGYRVATARSGPEALERLKRFPVDIIISDQRMPEMTGIEFLKQCRAVCPHAVRIMLSGHADLYADLEAVNEAGLYKLISKPWDDTELLHSLRSAMEWRQMVGQNATPIG